jgi:hypothetical protein
MAADMRLAYVIECIRGHELGKQSRHRGIDSRKHLESGRLILANRLFSLKKLHFLRIKSIADPGADLNGLRARQTAGFP